MDENGIWLEDQNVILQVFLKEFYKSFQKDRNVNIQPWFLYLRMSDSDNEWLIREVTTDEVWIAVKQIGPLKALGSDIMHAISYKSNL